MDDNRYEYKTYNTARFYVEEGMYSIEELEHLVATLKVARETQRKALAKYMQPIEVNPKEKNS